MNVFYKLILVSILVLTMSTSVKEDKCKRGEIYYSVANYEDEFFLNKKYSIFFDSLLYQPVFDCFCNNKIKYLPVRIGQERGEKHEESHIIEPLVVDLGTNDGLYAKRIFLKRGMNPRFRCGFFHFLFILSENSYYSFSNDSSANRKLVKAKLGKKFAQDALAIIDDYADNSVLCDAFTHTPPLYIKRGQTVLFDINKLDKE